MAQGHALTAIRDRIGAGASRPRFSEIALRHYIIHPSALPSTLTTSELQRRRSSARLYSRGSSVASSPLTHDRRLPERYGAEPLRSPRTRQMCAGANERSPPGNPNITPERIITVSPDLTVSVVPEEVDNRNFDLAIVTRDTTNRCKLNCQRHRIASCRGVDRLIADNRRVILKGRKCTIAANTFVQKVGGNVQKKCRARLMRRGGLSVTIRGRKSTLPCWFQLLGLSPMWSRP